MTTILSFIGLLIDFFNKLWEFSPIGFVLFVICIPIALVWVYGVVRESFVNPYCYPKEYLESMKSRSKKS